jgi:hypothetical protein
MAVDLIQLKLFPVPRNVFLLFLYGGWKIDLLELAVEEISQA